MLEFYEKINEAFCSEKNDNMVERHVVNTTLHVKTSNSRPRSNISIIIIID